MNVLNQKVLTVSKGDTLLDCAHSQGIPITHECGGNCACTTCKVEVISGESYLSPMELPERDRLELEGQLQTGTRLACQALCLRSNATIEFRNF